MAAANFTQVDDITREYNFNDGVNEHILTYKKETWTDKYNHEEFLNLNVHLDFSKSTLSILICQKLTEISNMKLIYKEIEIFSIIYPFKDEGINAHFLFKTKFPNSKISNKEFLSLIKKLENMGFVKETETHHFRAIAQSYLIVKQTLDQII